MTTIEFRAPWSKSLCMTTAATVAVLGVFSFTGRYWNMKPGWHRAFATDPGRAVVLRYPRLTVVITPHDPQHFIMRARTFINALFTGRSSPG